MRLTLAFAASILLGACASAQRPAPPPADAAAVYADVARYFPLAVGNRWTYQARLGGRVERSTVRIEEKQGGFFRDNRNGALAFDGEGVRDRDRYLILGPVEPGRTWESLLEDGRRERYEIVQTGATVQVPAGTFERVLVVRATTAADPRSSLEVEWAYAPGVGLVRMASTVISGDGARIPQAELELLSFDVE